MKKYVFTLLMSIFVFLPGIAQKLPVILVTSFHAEGNISEEDMSYFGDAITDEFTEISKGKFKVIDRETFEQRAAEQMFQSSDWSDKDKVAKIGKALNADYIIVGQLRQRSNGIKATIRVEDVNTTEIIAALPTSKNSAKDIDDVLDVKISEWCRYLIVSISTTLVSDSELIESKNSSMALSSENPQKQAAEKYEPKYESYKVNDGWGKSKKKWFWIGISVFAGGVVCDIIGINALVDEKVYGLGLVIPGSMAVLGGMAATMWGLCMENDYHWEQRKVSFDNTNFFQNMRVAVSRDAVSFGYTMHL